MFLDVPAYTDAFCGNDLPCADYSNRTYELPLVNESGVCDYALGINEVINCAVGDEGLAISVSVGFSEIGGQVNLNVLFQLTVTSIVTAQTLHEYRALNVDRNAPQWAVPFFQVQNLPDPACNTNNVDSVTVRRN